MMLPGCSSYCTFTALVRSREVLKTYFSSLFFLRRHKFKELQMTLIVYQVNLV